MAHQSATHEIQVDAVRGVVTKRFRSSDRGEPAREWNALTLLAEFAPNLAPAPVRADLAADSPVIEISRLPGVPLSAAPVSAVQAAALALALERLWDAVPRARLADLGRQEGNASQLVTRVTGMLTAQHSVDGPGPVRRARLAGAEWFSGGALRGLSDGDVVLGQGDSNLANFLWDGNRIRIVDFEDSGPSDRAFELAVLVEHISAWSDAGLSADMFLALFGLTATEQVTLREYRRLSALFWLLMLLPSGPAHHRNPPGTLERQAARLQLLLDRAG